MDVDGKKSVKLNTGYTFAEDMAIVKYMTSGNNYVKAAGIMVWKEAEKLQVCPGRSYLSMKERYRKVIAKNLERYNVEESVASKIKQFMRADRKGLYLLIPVPFIVHQTGLRRDHKIKKFKKLDLVTVVPTKP